MYYFNRLCANGSTMIEGLDFFISYAPIANIIAIHTIIDIEAMQYKRLYTLDIVNAYQSNYIDNPSNRHYMRLPYLYQQWFRRKWPQNPTNSLPENQLILQTFKSIQGTKDAGRDWFKLVDKFLQSSPLNMIPCTAFKGVYLWSTNDTTSYLCLTTDDMLLATSCHTNYTTLCHHLEQFFDYTSSHTSPLSFLNI